jgi:hypothetical protein
LAVAVFARWQWRDCHDSAEIIGAEDNDHPGIITEQSRLGGCLALNERVRPSMVDNITTVRHVRRIAGLDEGI